LDGYWVYILQVRNGNYYTGCTADMHRRYTEHVRGTGRCRYTRSFPPVRLAQCWKVNDSRGTALRIEQFVKRKPRRTKIDLIQNPALLTDLLNRATITDARVEPCAEAVLDDINNTVKRKTPEKKEVKTRGSPLK
jgi:putative endonuclease